MKRREAATTAHMEAGAGLRPPGVGGAFTLCAEDHPDSQESGGTCQEGALKAIKHLSMASTPTATELKASTGRFASGSPQLPAPPHFWPLLLGKAQSLPLDLPSPPETGWGPEHLGRGQDAEHNQLWAAVSEVNKADAKERRKKFKIPPSPKLFPPYAKNGGRNH